MTDTSTTVTFTKTGNLTGYRVWSADVLVGTVRKTEGWTVRGNRILWDASRAGKHIGSFPTRKEAAAALSSLAR